MEEESYCFCTADFFLSDARAVNVIIVEQFLHLMSSLLSSVETPNVGKHFRLTRSEMKQRRMIEKNLPSSKRFLTFDPNDTWDCTSENNVIAIEIKTNLK